MHEDMQETFPSRIGRHGVVARQVPLENGCYRDVPYEKAQKRKALFRETFAIEAFMSRIREARTKCHKKQSVHGARGEVYRSCSVPALAKKPEQNRLNTKNERMMIVAICYEKLCKFS